MDRNYLLCGVGGQGTVLASKLLAYAIMQTGESVKTSETIGMAQRGGSVVTHVRVGQNVHSPLVPKGKADLIVAFEPAEAVRCLPYLKPDGIVIVNQKPVKPVLGEAYDGNEMLSFMRETVKNLHIIDGDAICRTCGSPKVLNTILLAAAAKTGLFVVTPDELRDAIRARLPEKLQKINLQAIDEVHI